MPTLLRATGKRINASTAIQVHGRPKGNCLGLGLVDSSLFFLGFRENLICPTCRASQGLPSAILISPKVLTVTEKFRIKIFVQMRVKFFGIINFYILANLAYIVSVLATLPLLGILQTPKWHHRYSCYPICVDKEFYHNLGSLI